MTTVAGPIIVRLMSKLNTSEGDDSCWEWTGYRQVRGYGKMSVGSKVDGTKRMRLVHRLMWEQVNGPIPEGMLICHTCDNPPCANPRHLFLGTASDNMRDAYVKNRLKPHDLSIYAQFRQSKTHCKQGHPWTPENTAWAVYGYRICRACRRVWTRTKRQKKKAAMQRLAPKALPLEGAA